MPPKKGAPTGLDLLGQFTSAFDNRKVGIVEFAEDPEFCGKLLYPRQRVLLKLIFLEEMDGYEEDVLDEWIASSERYTGYNPGSEVRISPDIRKRRDILRDEGYNHFNEIELVGGRRSSKGHITGIAVAKRLYDMVRLDDPHRHYGIDPDKAIFASIIAASKDQAKEFQFADVVGAVTSCRALSKYIFKVNEEEFSISTPADLRKMARLNAQGFKIDRDMTSLRSQPFAANAKTVRGQAAGVVVMDEMAHMIEGVQGSKSGADEIYEALKPALEQFKKDAMLFGNSSPYTKVGKFFEMYELAMLPYGVPLFDARMMVAQFPSWELYRDWERDRRFKHAIMVPPEYDPNLVLDEQKNPEKFAVERRAIFAEAIDAFLSPTKVDQIFQPWDSEVLHTKTDREGGPEVKYKGHADPSTTTANFGLAMGHVEYRLDDQGREVPHVVFDYIHAWIPGECPDHTINYLDVQDEIVDLIYRFRPKEFSFDQFQSQGMMQYIRRQLQMKRASEVRVYEKTATEKVNYSRAMVFKTAINLGLVHSPNDNRFTELVRQELKFLQERNGKIVKQTTGPVQTKDVADCVMEVVDYLVGHYVAADDMAGLRLSAGSPGGYPIRGSASNPFSDFYQERAGSRNTGMRTRQPKQLPGRARLSRGMR